MSLAMNTTPPLTMQGVVYNGIPHQVSVAELPIPTLEADTDVIVKIKIAGICGTDLHMYHGFRGQEAPWGMGHEALGYILNHCHGNHGVFPASRTASVCCTLETR